MTSAPTACPDCNNCGLPCLNEIHHPRQPDTSAERDAEMNEEWQRAPGSQSWRENFNIGFRSGWHRGHARALKEMGAELLKSRMFYEHLATNEASKAQVLSEQLAAAQSEIARLNALDPAVIAYDTRSVRALTNLIKERDELREQLAAAQSVIERLYGNCEVKDKNKKRLERMYGELEQQLAAAQSELGDLKASMRSWEVAKEIEILANSDKQWNELITQRDAYEKALETLCKHFEPEAICIKETVLWIARTVLAAHTRPTKEAADE